MKSPRLAARPKSGDECPGRMNCPGSREIPRLKRNPRVENINQSPQAIPIPEGAGEDQEKPAPARVGDEDADCHDVARLVSHPFGMRMQTIGGDGGSLAAALPEIAGQRSADGNEGA